MQVEQTSKPLALILGAGASGYAMGAYLAREGFKLCVADTRSRPPLKEAFEKLDTDVFFSLGQMDEKLLEGVSLLGISPGLSIENGQSGALVKRARAAGIELVGEIELFAQALNKRHDQTGYAPKILAITGTNGKTTTTSLTGKMLVDAGMTVCVAGNIGPNALLRLIELEAEQALPEAWVLELSSFQLATLCSLKPTASAFLNVSEDHIDWHGSLGAYVDAKARIFTQGTIRVLNRADAALTPYLHSDETILTFGEDEPKAPGQWGLCKKDEKTYLCAYDYPALLLEETSLKIQGRHNAMNALAAMALATSAGVSLTSSIKTLRAYLGEPHRVEWVGQVNGVDFIDDSKGTNVGAVVAALNGFAAQSRRVCIVLGGDGKGQDFSPLCAALERSARAVALIGQDAQKIDAALESLACPKHNFLKLEDAVRWLSKEAFEGDIVLLSPACASWDMFKNYAQRSAVFIETVQALAQQKG